jgi:hypothetical protein
VPTASEDQEYRRWFEVGFVTQSPTGESCRANFWDITSTRQELEDGDTGPDDTKSGLHVRTPPLEPWALPLGDIDGLGIEAGPGGYSRLGRDHAEGLPPRYTPAGLLAEVSCTKGPQVPALPAWCSTVDMGTLDVVEPAPLSLPRTPLAGGLLGCR